MKPLRSFPCFTQLRSMIMFAIALLAVLATAEFKECDEQARFDVVMCDSHMCNDCALDWCTKKCQKVQLDYPDCRCEDWPESRKSYSDGDFAGKGKYGDSGDYSKDKL
eukprot:gnl/TRDRNA2_/TRDRNA2_190390_c0_seq1.p1 gnl/TRDRNA2_/TRDRNA2_190390_c0~~gnl/TRDRNA2_/TRDRNA2_190390_c0_seq1.p1  ORF type:complete len:108 (+),score=25.92 gnl/TRDRNA2_/TRDRNA2_190390_c0_seq1:88-411(+)